MDEFCRNDITAYLMVLASNLEHKLESTDPLIVGIVEQIEVRLNIPKQGVVFSQISHRPCKKCSLRYTERGSITKKEYSYCIRTDNSSLKVPPDCPMFQEKKDFNVEKIEDDQDIIDIRKQSKL